MNMNELVRVVEFMRGVGEMPPRKIAEEIWNLSGLVDYCLPDDPDTFGWVEVASTHLPTIPVDVPVRVAFRRRFIEQIDKEINNIEAGR